ncbi:MAG: alpha/beta hydrolase [Gammaproteobacteria bacterium]
MKFALKVLGGLLGLLVFGVLLTGLILKGLAKDVPPPGKLVEVGGNKLHIHCSGSLHDLPPVLIEAGLALSSPYYHWIQANLARSTKVCTYDRAGLGWSADGRRPRELGDVVAQLHTLLDATAFERPFVFAGHSLGAIIVREYVARYPAEVSGLAFLDGSHPDQTKVLGMEKLDLKADAEQGIGIYRWMVKLGLSRLYDPIVSPLKSSYPEPIIAELQSTNDGTYFDTVLAEYEGLVPYTNRPRPSDNFGDRPTVAIQAGDKWEAGMLPDTLDAEKVSAGWSKLQKETASLSTRGRYVVVKNATHMSLIYDEKYANQAAELIREVAAQSRK